MGVGSNWDADRVNQGTVGLAASLVFGQTTEETLSIEPFRVKEECCVTLKHKEQHEFRATVHHGKHLYTLYELSDWTGG